jgi:hypothetical protein
MFGEIMKKLKSVISKLYRKYFLKTHLFLPGIYIHRKNGAVVFETEFNWFDEELLPITVVREVKSGKIFSIRYDEMTNFIELKGNAPVDGSEI